MRWSRLRVQDGRLQLSVQVHENSRASLGTVKSRSKRDGASIIHESLTEGQESTARSRCWIAGNRDRYQIRSRPQEDTCIFVPTTDPRHERSEERRVGKECRSRWSPYH